MQTELLPFVAGIVIGLGAAAAWVGYRDRCGATRAEELCRARDAAEAATRAKSTFLANISHELRTPLNGVIGMVRLLARTNLDGLQRRYVQSAQASADLLLSLINDVLDLSKTEAGMLELESVPFRVPDVVQEVVDMLAVAAEEKHLALECDCATALRVPVCGDPTRLRQVLVNLVANALKFTPSGQVSVAGAVESETADEVIVRIEVRDSGIGVAAEDRARLFAPFTQADSATTRKYGGSGLGLAICKQLVEQMGGAIGVSSEPGDGSTFWFTVHLDRLPADVGGALTPTPADGPGGRVLIVEDNDVNAEVLAEVLAQARYQWNRVATGRAAVEAATSAAYDAVLMDCQLPGLDGFEATRRIRERGLARLPIIAVTASATKTDRARCLAAGMDDYVSKPLRPTDLLRLLAQHLQGGRPAPVADLDAALRRVEGRYEFLCRLGDRFVESLPVYLDDLRRELGRSDLAALAVAAHRLRGEASTFGAGRFVAQAGELESAARQGDASAANRLLPRLAAEADLLARALVRFGRR